MIRYVLSLIITIALLSIGKVHSQVITDRPGADTMKVVNLIHADRLSYLHPDSLTDLQTLAGRVKISQGGTIINCDSAVLNKRTRFVEAFGNVHIVDNDTVNIKSQYLQYYVDTKIAYLKNNVSLTDSKSTLLTNELQYDLNTKIGEYRNGGKLISQQSVLTSKEGTYYEELKDVYFKKNVDLKDPKYSLKTDSLLYNTNTQIATFVAPTTIIDSAKRTIKTSDGFYDTRNRKAFFGNQPVLTDGSVRITAKTIDSDDSTGISILRNNAVYVDTAQGISVLANHILANRSDGTFLATQHPLLIIKQENDSIYITADTLYSGRLSKLPGGYGSKDSSRLLPDTNRLQADTSFRKRDSGLLQRNSLIKVTKDSAALPDTTRLQTDMARVQPDSVSVPKDSISVPIDSISIAKDSIRIPRDTSFALRDTAKLQKKITNGKAVTPTAKKQPPTNKNAAKPAAVASKTTGKPVKDTTQNNNDSTDRFFQAWNHVRIFSDSMQAVSDSLWYSGKDSIFRLYTDPVMWASNSQITGDTIFLYTKNKNPDRLYVFENGLAINLSDKEMYNQIKGNRLNGYFKEGAIDYMRAQGNAESVYYVKDDKGYVKGINNATSDIIDLRFKNKELNKVVFVSEVTGTMYPVRQATEQNKYLRNFKWLEERRPKTKFELFEDIKPVIKKDADDSLDVLPPPVPGVIEQNKEQAPKQEQKQDPKQQPKQAPQPERSPMFRRSNGRH